MKKYIAIYIKNIFNWPYKYIEIALKYNALESTIPGSV